MPWVFVLCLSRCSRQRSDREPPRSISPCAHASLYENETLSGSRSPASTSRRQSLHRTSRISEDDEPRDGVTPPKSCLPGTGPFVGCSVVGAAWGGLPSDGGLRDGPA